MDMNRRSFLRGLLTVTAVSMAPASVLDAGLPRIVGDGIHDDTAGIQAAINGRPFVADGVVVRNQSRVTFGPGSFRMTAPFEVETSGVWVEGSGHMATRIICDHDGYMASFKECSNSQIAGFKFERPEGKEDGGAGYFVTVSSDGLFTST